jgi:hypothetical protein
VGVQSAACKTPAHQAASAAAEVTFTLLVTRKQQLHVIGTVVCACADACQEPAQQAAAAAAAEVTVTLLVTSEQHLHVIGAVVGVSAAAGQAPAQQAAADGSSSGRSNRYTAW